MKKGLLIVNLGTPAAPTPEAVAPYLKEFLMDPFVVDIPAPLRWILVNGLIVPRRKHTSSEAYKTVWTARGSPLLFHLLDLTQGVRKEIGDTWAVEAAMRYGEPSIATALEKLKAQDVAELTVLPLYPQYAESSSRSSIEKVGEEIARLQWQPRLHVIRSFHDDPGHIRAWVEVIREKLEASKFASTPAAHLLFSYHGLPERHLKKSHPTGSYCLDGGQPTNKESIVRKYDCCLKACARKSSVNRDEKTQTHEDRGVVKALELCYRAQSLDTTLMIVKELGLRDDQWSMSFQSRLGRTPWIKPYTDDVIPQLARRGVRSLTVVNPSFVADCLETIEEIGDRAKVMFMEFGGTDFHRIECLNSRPSWVKAVTQIVSRI